MVRHVVNRGKGAAVRTGFAVASGRFVAVIDADGQYDPRDLVPLVGLCDAGWDIAMGQRFDPSLTTTYSRLRSSASHLMLRLVRLVVDPALSETQAGIKVFRSEVVAAVAPHLECDGFAIDVEVLAWARALGYRRQAVHPVSFDHDGRTTVTLTRSIAMVRDLGRIRRRIRRSLPGALPSTRPRRSACRRERRARELWAQAARLVVVEPSTQRSLDELIGRASANASLLRLSAEMALNADRRSGGDCTDAARLLNDAASMVDRGVVSAARPSIWPRRSVVRCRGRMVR